MQGWMERLAEALGEPGLSGTETNHLLGVARDVAHRVERKATPLATFLLGSAVGRGVASGMSREDALAEALTALERSLPPPEPDA